MNHLIWPITYILEIYASYYPNKNTKLLLNHELISNSILTNNFCKMFTLKMFRKYTLKSNI